MIRQSHCEVHPWEIRETALDLGVLAQMESILALANGHIGLRANLDEGEPHAMPGTYLNGVFEARPLPYAEAGYGYPEAGQTVVNVTDGKIIRVMLDDEPFDVRYGDLRSHRRVLDMRAGTLTREVEWNSPVGQAMRLRSVRLVSLVHRAVAAILLEVEPLEAPARFVLQSELVANAELPTRGEQDPRAAAALRSPLVPEYVTQQAQRVSLIHATRASRLRLGAAMDHVIEGPATTATSTDAADDLGRVTVTSDVPPGHTLRIVKFLAYGWSAERSRPAVLDQVEGALAEARHTGWDGLVAAQREALDSFWEHADVELDGDPELQQAVRFGLFHTLQASARAERRAIPAKGLTGPGYDGHAFWDTEMFVLPLLTYTVPAAARDALWWRHSTLSLARARATVLGHRGAAFPWRTIRGEECSGYWPAGTAAFHVTAGVADAVVRYIDATEDRAFERDAAVELLVESARLWAALGHHDPADGFRIDGVTGPDEYSALADNNVYTNLMAQRNLRAAVEVAERHVEQAEHLGVDAAEIVAWRDAAAAMVVPWDERLRVHPQAEGFTRHEEWDFAATPTGAYPLLLHFPYFDLYRKQVVKQPDLVLALHVCGEAFTDEEKARNFEYYEQRTVRDSSLSASTQAVMAAEVGHVELAYDYFGEAALMDLHDLQHNTRDGVHIASLAGAWTAAVAGLGGMRAHGGALSFAPRLPEDLGRLAFRIDYRDRLLKVEVTDDAASYTLLSGEPLEVAHHGEPIRLTGEQPVSRPVPPAPELTRPRQPPGREPRERRHVWAQTASAAG